MIIHNPILTGSFTVNGTDVSSITSSAANITSLNAATASLNTFSASMLTFTASAATTGSNTFVGNQVVTGSLTVTGSITTPGTLTAQTLVVQTITSSVDFVTGSTRFGSILANTHVFSGSVTMNPGGLFVSGSGLVGIGTSSPADNLHIAASEVGNVGISVQNTNASYSSQLRFLNSAGTEKAAVTYVQSTTSLNLNVNQIDALTIGSTGQVNINSSIASNTILNITNGTAGGSGILIQAGNSYDNYALKVLNAAGAEKLRLDGNGNLLVGYTTDMGYKFGVNGTSIFASAALFQSTIDCNGTLRFRRIGFSQINTGASQTVTIIDAPGTTAFRSLQVVITAFEQTNAAIIQLKFDVIARWSGASLIQSGIGNINRHYCRGFGDFAAYTGLSADIGTSGNAVTLILTNSSAGYINNISCNITENY